MEYGNIVHDNGVDIDIICNHKQKDESPYRKLKLQKNFNIKNVDDFCYACLCEYIANNINEWYCYSCKKYKSYLSFNDKRAVAHLPHIEKLYCNDCAGRII